MLVESVFELIDALGLYAVSREVVPIVNHSLGEEVLRVLKRSNAYNEDKGINLLFLKPFHWSIDKYFRKIYGMKKPHNTCMNNSFQWTSMYDTVLDINGLL